MSQSIITLHLNYLPFLPYFQSTYLNTIQKQQFIPIVILEGNAWGFIRTSGVIPLSVNGISIYGHNILRTP